MRVNILGSLRLPNYSKFSAQQRNGTAGFSSCPHSHLLTVAPTVIPLPSMITTSTLWSAARPGRPDLCRRCLCRLARRVERQQQHHFFGTRTTQAFLRSAAPVPPDAGPRPYPRYLRKSYFFSNVFQSPPSGRRHWLVPWSLSNGKGLPKGLLIASINRDQLPLFEPAASIVTDCSATSASPPAPQQPPGSPDARQPELPHRRQQRLRRATATVARNNELRPDASTRLANMSTVMPTTSLKRQLALYLALAKPHLSFLIVLTSTTAYGLYPVPSVLALDPAIAPLPTLSTSTLTFFYLVTGTFLSSASANTLNMLFEPKYDAQMSRTRNRPLVRGLVSSRAAVLFAIACGFSGISALYFGTNPTVAGLSAFNLCLYAFAYTPLKRISVINTWVGAVVGGIPPLMGWVAAAGQTATTGHAGWRDMLMGPDSAGGWLLAALLYAWQFPHFNALSHNIRDEYRRAGYQMLAWHNPARNGRVALRYALLMFPICAGLWYVGVVDRAFLVGGSLANAWFARDAFRFWRLGGAQGSSRALFWASIWQLPILMVGAMLTKRGVWDGVLQRMRVMLGYVDEDEEDEFEYLVEGEVGRDGNIVSLSDARPSLS